uniref:hypothetical protein n=1 Tax=Falsiroseomonas oryzae TaxID=2766473 RepID=UPI0038CBFE62
MTQAAMRAPPMADIAAPARHADALGVAAALGAATIWGGALAMTRVGVAEASAALGPHDMVLLRFLAPAALLLPVALRVLPRLRPGQLWLLLA